MTRLKITQYGISIQAGGWDGKGDSGTDQWLGNEGNTLVDGVSCALTQSAQKELCAKFGDTLLITYDDGSTEQRIVADRAPEDDGRLDRFNAYRELSQPSDFANVVILTS